MKDKLEKGYHKLIAWKKTNDFVFLIYKYTDKFPRSEEFGLKGQIRRASVSVLLNIVEGYRRSSRKEFLRFLDIAQASLTEVEAILEIAFGLRYLTNEEAEFLEEKRTELGYILNGLVKSLKNKL